MLVAAQDGEAVISALAAPETRIASFTVTEKGYCRGSGGLDLASADRSFYPHLARAFRRRMAAGLPGLTLLSCDNLADNGHQLAALMAEYLDHHATDLRRWFEAECACPSTMVDRIVPATTPADRTELAELLGVTDEAAVMTEPFRQWVIEDRFASGRPRWELAGAQIVSDVAAYETAKLRMLNGAHSLLAYCGLDAGYSFVHEAVADPRLRGLVADLLTREAAPSVEAGAGQDLSAYAEALLARFANPALNHRLIQIAMDGSQKLPQRWLATLAWHQRRGAGCPSILTGIAAWLRHVRGDRRVVEDPMADALAETWRNCSGAELIEAIFGSNGLLTSEWQPSAADRESILQAIG